MIKVDFHLHTSYSHDSSASIEEILRIAKKRGLGAIAITDHDSFEGNLKAKKIRKKGDVEIIPGIELGLPIGKHGLHLVALNINQKIKYQGIIKTIEKLKKLNSTIILPHPFRAGTGLFYHLKKGNISKKESEFILKSIDYLEVLNMKDDVDCVKKTIELANKLNKPIVSGTDAHSPEYIGLTYTEVLSLKSFFEQKSKTIIGAYLKKELSNLDQFQGYLETGNESHFRRNSNFFRRIINQIDGKIEKFLVKYLNLEKLLKKRRLLIVQRILNKSYFVQLKLGKNDKTLHFNSET